MSIDDRLRTGMAPVGGLPSASDPAFVRAVAAQAEHRQKVRRLTALSCAAALLVVAAVVVPKALASQQSDLDPAKSPTTSPPTSTETLSWNPPVTPIDESWGAPAVPRAMRLATLDGTAMDRYGPQVFRALYPGWPAYHTPETRCDCAPSSLTLEWGSAQLDPAQTGFGGGLRLEGPFSVRGDRVTFDFDGVGKSTFRWRLDRHDWLVLEFVSAEPGSTIAGAPAEAALRMLLTDVPFRH